MVRSGLYHMEGFSVATAVTGRIWQPRSALMPPSDKLDGVEFSPDVSCTYKKDGRKVDLASLDREGLSRFLRQLSREPVSEAPVLESIGPMVTGANVMVSASNDLTHAKAVLCRIFRRPQQKPAPGIWRWVRQFMPILLPGFREQVEPLDFEEWLSRMPARRQKPLRQASDDYRRCGWDVKFEKFKAFVKTEKLPGFSKEHGLLQPLTEMVDRLIQAPHDATHVIAGPQLVPRLERLKSLWKHTDPLFYASVTPEKMLAWLQRVAQPGATVFWSDFSMFDNSHSSETWEFMEWLYNESDIDFKRVMNAWRAPFGHIGNIQYKARIMNASGRDDTALANAVLNGIATALSSAASLLRIPLRELTPMQLRQAMTNLNVAICGDDSLGIGPPMSAERRVEFRDSFRDNIRIFGFQAKAYVSDRMVDGVFCGARPARVDGRWYWHRTLGRSIYKLGYRVGLEGDGAAHMHGVMKQLVSTCSHTPVLSDLAHSYCEQACGMKWNPPPRDEYQVQTLGPEWYSKDTIQDIADAYSARRGPGREDLPDGLPMVSPEDVIHLVNYIRGRALVQPCVLDHWLLTHMVYMDEL